MRFIGILLVAFGLVGLIWGGISYTRDKKAVDFGPIEINVKEKKEVRIPPIVGGVSLAAGVAVILLNWRRR